MNDLNGSTRVNREDVIQIRALCDEIVDNLCQLKALFFPVNIDEFFELSDVELLRHYFHAINSFVESAIVIKDDLHQIVASWGKPDNG